MATFPSNDIMSLTASTPRFDLAESLGPDLRLAELVDGLGDMRLGYGPVAGSRPLRERIAACHGVSPDDVLVTVGGMHALFLLAFTLLDARSHAVVVTPVFPSALATLRVTGAEVTELPVSFDQGYRLDAARVVAALTPATRLVSLASPQNPSGVSVDADTISAIACAMRARCPEARLVVDETYREAVYGNTPPPPTALRAGENVVVCASLSKCHGAPGLRVGWLVGVDADLQARLTAAKFNTVVSNSVVDEALAVRVLDMDAGERRQRAEHLGAGRALMAEWVERHAALVEWVAPDAGALCCIRLREPVFDAAAVQRVHEQMAHADVRLADGRWFGASARVLRAGFGLLGTQDTALGLASWSKVLKASCSRVGASGVAA